MKCKDCPYWYPDCGEYAKPCTDSYCHYPYDDEYAPCKQNEPITVPTTYVTITQTRTIVVPLDLPPAQALALVAKEYADNGTAALGTNGDWQTIKTSITVYETQDDTNHPL